MDGRVPAFLTDEEYSDSCKRRLYSHMLDFTGQAFVMRGVHASTSPALGLEERYCDKGYLIGCIR